MKHFRIPKVERTLEFQANCVEMNWANDAFRGKGLGLRLAPDNDF